VEKLESERREMFERELEQIQLQETHQTERSQNLQSQSMRVIVDQQYSVAFCRPDDDELSCNVTRHGFRRR